MVSVIASTISSVFVVVIALLCAILGWIIIVLGAKLAYRSTQAHGRSNAVAGVVASAVALVLLLGGWMVLGLYWLTIWVRRRMDNDGPHDQFYKPEGS